MTHESVKRHAAFLREAAHYFETRDTLGEDMAFWANHQNAENCRKTADALESQPAELTRLRERNAELDGIVADYEQALESKRKNTRDLDIAMHGEDGAAQQASLCDLIEPARRMRARIAELETETLRLISIAKCKMMESSGDRKRIASLEARNAELEKERAAQVNVATVTAYESGFEAGKPEVTKPEGLE